MATRTTEAATLNATLATLATDVAAYLAAGDGDVPEARQAVLSALVRRLNPGLGRIEFRTPSLGAGLSTEGGIVPDEVRSRGETV